MSDTTNGDHKRAFSLMSAVAANLDRLRSSIDGLRQLHDRWPDGSGTIINLIAQLSSLKANLGEMQDWMNYAINEMHSQLLNDLDLLMTSCSLLVRNLDGLTAQMRQPDHDKADWALKLKFRVGSRSMNKLRGVAKNQTDAPSEEPPTEEDYLTAAAAMRSDAIDRQLESDELNLRRETKLVLVGQPHSGKELVMRQMKVIYAEGYPISERYQYRVAVRSTVRLLIHSIIDLIKDTGVPLTDDLTPAFAVLLHEVETSDMSHLSPAAVTATQKLWTSPTFSTLYVKNFEIDFPQYASYYAENIARIASDDYVPSEADIIRLNQSSGGIKELRFAWDELGVHLFNISGFIPDQFRKRWFHQLENASALIYTVDVSTYDQPYLGQPTESQLLDDFATFESYANSPKFAGSSIILLLNNFTRFKEKLAHTPLETFFADYFPPAAASAASPNPPHSATSSSKLTNPSPTPDATPTPDAETAARQYILRRFKAVNRARLSIYSFWVDLDMSDNTHLYAALKKTLLHIQQRKARSEVWSEGSTNGRDSARGHRRDWSGSLGVGSGVGSGRGSTVKSKGSELGLVSQFSNASR
ncbi:hypothetical protein SLS60_011715 [Paraconiothyrium brasiliense]|uniref:Uncharacterized protein n=1 Tax=Paraconiothyrium brasiliense TaxID=300254 RepID=A0ABR3QHT6_9PLEO